MNNLRAVVSDIINLSFEPVSLCWESIKPDQRQAAIKAMVADDISILDDFAAHLAEDEDLTIAALKFHYTEENQPLWKVVNSSLCTFEPFEWKFNETLAEILDELGIHEDDPGVMDQGMHEKRPLV